MKASGLCGSDPRHYRAAKADRGDPANLKVAGHEPCGVIAEVGPGVTEVAVGDRVMMHQRNSAYPILHKIACANAGGSLLLVRKQAYCRH